MFGNIKLALGVCHLYDVATYMILFFMIFIFFKNSYLSLSLFFFLFSMILVDSFKNLPKFFKPSKFFFILKIFLFL